MGWHEGDQPVYVLGYVLAWRRMCRLYRDMSGELKYIDMIEEMFPGKDYMLEFSRSGPFGLEIRVRIEDYAMMNQIERGFGMPRKQLIERGILDLEIQYMLEALKGKIDDVKANRRLP